MKYYKSVNTGKILRDHDLSVIYDVYGLDVEHLILSKTIEKFPNPSVIDCLINGSKVMAVFRYREIHGCSLAEARKVVEAIIKDMRIARSTKKKAVVKGE